MTTSHGQVGQNRLFDWTELHTPGCVRFSPAFCRLGIYQNRLQFWFRPKREKNWTEPDFKTLDVCHRLGQLNVVADRLSRKFVNTPKEEGDRHEWTVSEDWEACTKLANDILVIHTAQLESTYDTLRTRFAHEKVFIEVIDSILELDHGMSLRVRKRAKHKAKGYMIEEGKLWKIGDGSDRARVRVECVTKEETVQLTPYPCPKGKEVSQSWDYG